MPSNSPTSSVLVGSVRSPGNRIQLAPLLHGGGGHGHGSGCGHGHSSHAGSSTSPVLGHSSMSYSSSSASTSGGGGNANANGLGGGASGGASGSGYSDWETGSRPEYSPIGGSREREGRDDQRRERDGDVCGGAGGKKNPLSIGNIVSDDAREWFQVFFLLFHGQLVDGVYFCDFLPLVLSPFLLILLCFHFLTTQNRYPRCITLFAHLPVFYYFTF